MAIAARATQAKVTGRRFATRAARDDVVYLKLNTHQHLKVAAIGAASISGLNNLSTQVGRNTGHQLSCAKTQCITGFGLEKRDLIAFLQQRIEFSFQSARQFLFAVKA